jgi:hypothetical protein
MTLMTKIILDMQSSLVSFEVIGTLSGIVENGRAIPFTLQKSHLDASRKRWNVYGFGIEVIQGSYAEIAGLIISNHR